MMEHFIFDFETAFFSKCNNKTCIFCFLHLSRICLFNVGLT